MKLLNLLKKRFNATHWADKQIEKNKLDYILDCIYHTPSKQCRYAYEVFVLNNSTNAQSIKEWLFWENTVCVGGSRFNAYVDPDKVNPQNNRYNGQVRAPTVLIWIGKNKSNDTKNDCVVSATVAMMAAQEQNIDTGFCGCFGMNDVPTKLDRKDHYAHMILGLGYIDYMTETSNTVIAKEYNRKVYKNDVYYGNDTNNIASGLTHRYRSIKPSKNTIIKSI
tara:strand:- start:9630 stop:10295 length:666 start_codon:yes stop_codon:yes gene_type:complete